MNKQKVLGAWLGTVIEYYDYSLYAFAVLALSKNFLPHQTKKSSLVYIFAIYAIGYISKPIGALLFSRIGDFYGRKIALNITVYGIAFPTFLIGILPTYDQIGYWSTVILVVCRFSQGIFAGGEYDGAAIYVIEHLKIKSPYFASALTRSMGVLGLLIGVISVNFFSSNLFPSWGWRISFLISFPLSIVVMYYRKYMEETHDFINSKKKAVSIISTTKLFLSKWKLILLIVVISGSCGGSYQISIIFIKQYLPLLFPQTNNIITSLSVIIVLIFCISMPIAGFLAEKLEVLFVIKYSCIIVLSSIIFFLFGIYFNYLNLVLISTILIVLCVAPANALSHAIMVQILDINERYRIISIGHSIGSMLISGSANYICAQVIHSTNFIIFPLIYLFLLVFISSFVLIFFSKKIIR